MKKILLILAIGWAAWGCVRDDDHFSCDWNYDQALLVYMVGEDALTARDGYAKIHAMAGGYTFSEKQSVLIYFDSQTDRPHLWELLPDGQIGIVESYDEQNSASGDVFNNVILRARQLRPSRHWGLLVFSHGQGWMPGNMYEQPRAVSRTITIDQGYEMEISDFAAAIPDGMFDFIVLEACYTAGIEMIWPLRNKADYILGSSAEIVAPGFEKAYLTAACDELVKGNLETFAEAAFGEVNGSSHHSGTLSIIKTSALEPLAAFIAANCDFSQSVNVSTLQRFGRTPAHRMFFDFEQYYSLLLPSDAKRQEFSRLVAAAIPWREATESFLLWQSGFTITRHSGMTTYVPQTIYPQLNAAWGASDWGQAID